MPTFAWCALAFVLAVGAILEMVIVWAFTSDKTLWQWLTRQEPGTAHLWERF